MESSGLKKKIAIITLIILTTLTIFSQIITLRVNAVDVKITSITPITQRGKVGETVRVIGTINTTDGRYEIWFEKDQWRVRVTEENETASGNNVNASFAVPTLPGGNYTLILKDVTANINATSWFIIETAYILKVSKPEHPKQLQQGAEVNISIGITGGNASINYFAKVTVKNPVNETYSKEVQLSTKDDGTGNVTITYPSSNTNYTGTYTVIANFSGTIVTDMFFIGLTNSTEYHRRQTVDIKAIYAAYENVTLKIEGKGVSLSKNLTANDQGIVYYAEWSIPENATMGSYKISIISISNITRKTSPDIQNFTVPGFKIQICTRNLADETVSNVTIKVHDQWANQTYNGISNSTGFANIMLEVGEHDFTAYYKGVKVNQTSVFIESERTLDIRCQLTNLNISVVSAQNQAIRIPFVSLRLHYNFTTDLDGGKSANETVFIQTDITGTAKLHSLIINASYKVNASRYGKVFNQTTFTYLEITAWNNRTITCPERVLHVNVVDGDGHPIENATVEAQEFMGGLSDEGKTYHDGNVTLHCIFGKYYVRVYSNKTLLEETTVELFDDKNVTIRCILYNLPIYVKVIDYFGQPIPNAKVTLERNGDVICSNFTKADGFAYFRENGGELTIKVYLAESELPEASITVYVGEKRDYANPIVVKVGKYIALAGLLVDTAQFAMAILVLATIVLIAIIEILRRKRVKTGKTSS
jgi:hypothetical protein